MIIGLRVLIIVSLFVGIIVCAMGMKTKNALYKGGFYFFLISLISNIYTLIIPRVIENLIYKEIDNVGHWINILNMPPLLLTFISLVILIIFLLTGLNSRYNNSVN